jgi:hypothetical protein
LRQELVVKTYPYRFDDIKTQFEEMFSDKRITVNELQTYLYMIKGRPFWEILEDELIAELKDLKQKDKNAFIVINKGLPTVALIQTSAMIENWYRYGSVLQVYASQVDSRFTKYKLHALTLSGIAPNGQTIIFAVCLFSVLCRESYEWIFRKFKEKYSADGILTSTIIISIDKELREAIETILTPTTLKRYKSALTNSLSPSEISILVDHHSLSQYLHKYIPSSAHPSIWPLITSPTTSEQFMLQKDEVSTHLLTLSLPPSAQTAIEDLFDCQHCWSMARVGKVFTKGLHREGGYVGAKVVGRILRELEGGEEDLRGFVDRVVEVSEKVYLEEGSDGQGGHRQLREVLGEENAMGVYGNRMFDGIKREFTEYGVSLLMHQIMGSFKMIPEETEEEHVFIVQEEENEYLVEKLSRSEIICN